jgi:hypothetical protein
MMRIRAKRGMLKFSLGSPQRAMAAMAASSRAVVTMAMMRRTDIMVVL